jgi:isopentenyl diphosphate isomerase/L-lactate dehydrogenase-like FMN-dependent dehydrogenase
MLASEMKVAMTLTGVNAVAAIDGAILANAPTTAFTVKGSS